MAAVFVRISISLQSFDTSQCFNFRPQSDDTYTWQGIKQTGVKRYGSVFTLKTDQTGVRSLRPINELSPCPGTRQWYIHLPHSQPESCTVNQFKRNASSSPRSRAPSLPPQLPDIPRERIKHLCQTAAEKLWQRRACLLTHASP